MKEKLWNANYIKVMTTNFLLYFAFYLLTPLLPLYLSENFGATKDVIGIVLSGYTVAALIIRPFSGYVVDSFSRKKVLMLLSDSSQSFPVSSDLLALSDFPVLSDLLVLSGFPVSCLYRLLPQK